MIAGTGKTEKTGLIKLWASFNLSFEKHRYKK